MTLQPGATLLSPPVLPLAPGVALPSNASVYRSGAGLTVGPRGWNCSGAEGGDGSLGQEVSESPQPEQGADSVQTIAHFGGVGVDVSVACEYFPNLQAVIDPDNEFCADSERASGALTPLPTGVNGVYVTLNRPPLGADSQGTPVTSRDESYSLFTAMSLPNGFVGTSATECTLPASEIGICTADLALFIQNNVKVSPEQRLLLVDRITDLLEPGARAVASADASEIGKCHGHFDTSVEREIHQLSTKMIPVQIKGIGLPSKLSGGVAGSVALGDMTICESALTATLHTSLPTFDGDVSLEASETSGKVDGPFDYSIPHLRWVSVPGAPSRQRLETSFSSAKVSFEVNPHLGLAFSQEKSGEAPTPGLALSLVSLSLQAPRGDVTLVSAGQELLEAGVGPTLTLSLQISKSASEEAAEDEESEGEPKTTAISDAAEEISADADAGLYEEALNFYDVVLDETTSKEIYSQLDSAVLTALEADPALPSDEELADEPNADTEAADEVPFEGVTADTEAALDAEIGDAAIGVGADLIEILPFLAF